MWPGQGGTCVQRPVPGEWGSALSTIYLVTHLLSPHSGPQAVSCGLGVAFLSQHPPGPPEKPLGFRRGLGGRTVRTQGLWRTSRIRGLRT